MTTYPAAQAEQVAAMAELRKLAEAELSSEQGARARAYIVNLLWLLSYVTDLWQRAMLRSSVTELCYKLCYRAMLPSDQMFERCHRG